MIANKMAIEFIQYVLQQNPEAHDFGAIYDAMARTACARSFHQLGYAELSRLGVSFSLLDINKLEGLIREARRPDSPLIS